MRRMKALLPGLMVTLALSTSAQEPARPQEPAPPAGGAGAQGGVPPAPPDASGQPVFRTGINFVRVDEIGRAHV